MPLLNLLFVKAFTDYKVHVYFKIDKFITYLRFGLPLFFISLSDLLLKSIDKLMIAKMVGLEPLGMYTLVGMVGNYTTEASKNFNIVVTPYFLEDHGRTNDVRKVSRYLVLSAEMMSCIMAIVLGAIYIVMPVFTACILPRFSPAVTATRISLLALFFQVASPQSMNFLIAMNKQRRILAIMGLGVIVSATANYYLIGAGFGISGAAMAAAISSFTVFFAMTCSAVKMFSDLREGAYFFLRIMVPPLLICATVLCLGEFIRADDVHGTVLKLAIFILLSIPVMVHMNTRTNFIKTIVAIFTRKA
jgi:O-antigen/teichoic acid export membrane protein